MARKSPDLTAKFFRTSGALAAPAGLPPAAERLWTAIQRETPLAQWRCADEPLLGAYCRAAALADEAAAHLEAHGQVAPDGKISAWVAVLAAHTKTLAVLGGKLRLSPSSRIRPENFMLRQEPASRRPWELSDADADLLPGLREFNGKGK